MSSKQHEEIQVARDDAKWTQVARVRQRRRQNNMKALKLLVLFVLVGCTFYFAAPEDATRFEPPAIYREWYDLTAACVGIAGRFEDLEWYVLAEAWLSGDGSRTIDGQWFKPHSVYVSVTHQYDQRLIRGEMIHDLIQGGGDHPPIFAACSR